MNKAISLSIMALLALSILPLVVATSVGTGIGADITVEKFAPQIWMCDNRVVADDRVQWGRVSLGDQDLVERINNYAFEGESIHWTVLVMDKNGVEKIEDVFGTIGDNQGEGNDIEVNCERVASCEAGEQIDPSCNARILEEEITQCNPEMMAYYECTLTVETPESMYGEFWVTIEAVDLDGLSATVDENEYWFFNPIIALSVDGDMAFEDVRPGTSAYSDTILVGNDADDSSGVMMDMFISGTDFYDSSSSGAKCSEINGVATNMLALNAFRYYAVNGAYSTTDDDEDDNGDYDPQVVRDVDAEGYLNIQHGDNWEKAMYNEAEILQDQQVGPYYTANILAPGAEMALTFRLDLPEPCNGDFDSGQIYFWGEAI